MAASSCFDFHPRVVTRGKMVRMTIRPVFDHCGLDPSKVYQLTILPLEGLADGTDARVAAEEVGRELATFTLSPSAGAVAFDIAFPEEQEYALLLRDPQADRARPLATLKIYCVDKDLAQLRPWKGDVHMHTFRSDGKESPAYMAGACRRIGLDFAAITDHMRYGPSLEAMRAYEGVELDLRLYPGEEIHPPDNPVHMVNFGGRFSINDLFAAGSHAEQVAAIDGGLPRGLSTGNRAILASCQWCFQKIREAGGLGVFCHPFWIYKGRYQVPAAVTDQLLDSQAFGAVELIAGYDLHEVESNALQIARYNDERARGRRIPIVGTSDSHSCETGNLFGWYYTIVFSRSPELQDLVGAIKDLRSVAVEALPGSSPRAHGPFRLVKYAQFLLREIMPMHDSLCVEEGKLMIRYAAGEQAARAELSRCRGRTEALFSRFFDS